VLSSGVSTKRVCSSPSGLNTCASAYCAKAARSTAQRRAQPKRNCDSSSQAPPNRRAGAAALEELR
jgi:hypothetical protein